MTHLFGLSGGVRPHGLCCLLSCRSQTRLLCHGFTCDRAASRSDVTLTMHWWQQVSPRLFTDPFSDYCNHDEFRVSCHCSRCLLGSHVSLYSLRLLLFKVLYSPSLGHFFFFFFLQTNTETSRDSLDDPESVKFTESLIFMMHSLSHVKPNKKTDSHAGHCLFITSRVKTVIIQARVNLG